MAENNKMDNIKVELELPFDLNCEMCEVVNEMAYINCTKTYSECRNFRKDLWKKVDKQLNMIRKKVFEQILVFEFNYDEE